MTYKGELMTNEERCDACEQIINKDEDGHGGAPYEAYYEGYHLCEKGKEK